MSENEEIRKRLEKATPGPWSCERDDAEHGDIYYAIHGSKYEFITNVHEISNKANADFIAHAPTDIAALLSDNATLRSRLESIERETMERAVEIVNSEEELEGEAPLEIVAQALRSGGVGVIAVMRATVRATKESIASRIRALSPQHTGTK